MEIIEEILTKNIFLSWIYILIDNYKFFPLPEIIKAIFFNNEINNEKIFSLNKYFSSNKTISLK